jgi:hypothetical protein
MNYCWEVCEMAAYSGQATYLAQRIIDGALEYDYVISKRPDLKEGIDVYLREKGREDLITQ